MKNPTLTSHQTKPQTAATMTEQWQIHGGEYLGEISALSFLHLPPHFSSLPYLLAGTGSHLLLYNLESSSTIRSFLVFQGIRVHGITCQSIQNESLSQDSCSTSISFRVAVFGEKSVKLFQLSVNLEQDCSDGAFVELDLVYSLPRFSHWILDVSFLKSSDDGNNCLSIGCSDNSVCIWDIGSHSLILQVHSPERCLLYSMRLWGDNLGALRIASGTIFNEIIIWKVVSEDGSTPSTILAEDGQKWISSSANSSLLHPCQYTAAHISKLIGHEGSIFRIAWSSDGSKLVSVSDDRSARIWAIGVDEKGSNDKQESMVASTVLFGHNARVWDCCIFESLVVTAGEDCTCRVWKLDGKQLRLIKEHIGRGVWRCLYDPNSSIIITAGFDSAVKVHLLPASLPQSLDQTSEQSQISDRAVILAGRIPHSYEYNGLMDSKSEYVRCLAFTSEDAIYVATNHGYLYHAKVSETGDIKWNKLVQLSEEVPIVCMDLLSQASPENISGIDDWIALGDGKGNVTVVRIVGLICTPKVDCVFNWSAEKERQLLGVYYCKELGYRHIFTTDPRGSLKLWRLSDPLLSDSDPSARTPGVFLVTEFTSSFGFRIMCLGVSFQDRILVCGDLRGNLVLFSLPDTSLMVEHTLTEAKIAPKCSFKGAHGISSVCSISVVKLSSYQTEICSTGGDGCICYLEYDLDQQALDFIGLKQVKELSLIRSVTNNSSYPSHNADCQYAVGFASTDFIIWNLLTETKVVQIPCGGWRRPYSFYLGDVPEVKHSFAYVKDEIIYIHQQRAAGTENKMYPKNLHIQFHGREMHSLCFVSESVGAIEKCGTFDRCSWIATGCEDGTVRLTRFAPGTESWSESKLLGEHVGGSAVRSICFVSKTSVIASRYSNFPNGKVADIASTRDRECPQLLISVGAKRVLTSWLLRDRSDVSSNSLLEHVDDSNGNGSMPFLGQSSSISCKWLSTDMPTRVVPINGKMKHTESMDKLTNDLVSLQSDKISKSFAMEKEEKQLKSVIDKCQDDWRYLAVTAFLVKCSGSRLTVCFVVVACSDATLVLRAIVLPHRLWYDVAQLVSVLSPVLALQHVIVPTCLHSEDNVGFQNLYIIISGSTDGSIVFWDLTDRVEAFMQQLSASDVERSIGSPARPRTGRGSQGGRWWKSLSSTRRKLPGKGSATSKAGEVTNSLVNDDNLTIRSNPKDCSTVGSQTLDDTSVVPEVDIVEDLPTTPEIQPLHAINSVHQSGVNCLHVSNVEDRQSSENCSSFGLISGGDDQALHYLKFEISQSPTVSNSTDATPYSVSLPSNSRNIYLSNGCQREQKSPIRFLRRTKIASAHSSAVKGVWTDGSWVFSTGLDQRIRFWHIDEDCKLIEKSHLIVSVPEPEALHAREFGRNRYQIAIVGRGMQMVEFSTS